MHERRRWCPLTAIVVRECAAGLACKGAGVRCGDPHCIHGSDPTLADRVAGVDAARVFTVLARLHGCNHKQAVKEDPSSSGMHLQNDKMHTLQASGRLLALTAGVARLLPHGGAEATPRAAVVVAGTCICCHEVIHQDFALTADQAMVLVRPGLLIALLRAI
eukprot:COSAG06_NODE_7065_length_2648_cov_16.589643_2_plen_162_part_00